MDSRSGPEGSHKVHAFREAVKRPRPSGRNTLRTTAQPSWGGSALALALAWLATACGGDPTTVEGALSHAASAVARGDYEDLFACIDERSRFALSSVYYARRRAAQLIRESYPKPAQASALGELGDAAQAESAVDLFRRRCDEACVQAFSAQLGAPRRVRSEGRLVTVETVRGTTAQLYRGDDGRYGLVWDTAALARERTRTAAELDLIQKNAALYNSHKLLK
jgi:hypothetical protein